MMGSLNDTLAIWQLVRHIGENILVAGLLVDLFVMVFLHDNKKLEKRGSILGTVVITVGVMVENIAGGYGDRVVERMRAPRSLTDMQQRVIGEKLKTFGVHEAVLFEISDVDPEVSGITADLSRAAAFAGWKSGFEGFPPTPPEDFRAPDRGILVSVSPGAPDKNVLPAAKALVSMLEADGLAARLSQSFFGPKPPLDNRVLIVVYVK